MCFLPPCLLFFFLLFLLLRADPLASAVNPVKRTPEILVNSDGHPVSLTTDYTSSAASSTSDNPHGGGKRRNSFDESGQIKIPGDVTDDPQFQRRKSETAMMIIKRNLSLKSMNSNDPLFFNQRQSISSCEVSSAALLPSDQLAMASAASDANSASGVKHGSEHTEGGGGDHSHHFPHSLQGDASASSSSSSSPVAAGEAAVKGGNEKPKHKAHPSLFNRVKDVSDITCRLCNFVCLLSQMRRGERLFFFICCPLCYVQSMFPSCLFNLSPVSWLLFLSFGLRIDAFSVLLFFFCNRNWVRKGTKSWDRTAKVAVKIAVVMRTTVKAILRILHLHMRTTPLNNYTELLLKYNCNYLIRGLLSFKYEGI